MSKSKDYSNTVGLWPRYSKTPYGIFIGAGLLTPDKGKSKKVVMYINFPKKAPKELRKQAKLFFQELNDWSFKYSKKRKKKDKTVAPFYSVRLDTKKDD